MTNTLIRIFFALFVATAIISLGINLLAEGNNNYTIEGSAEQLEQLSIISELSGNITGLDQELNANPLSTEESEASFFTKAYTTTVAAKNVLTGTVSQGFTQAGVIVSLPIWLITLTVAMLAIVGILVVVGYITGRFG